MWGGGGGGGGGTAPWLCRPPLCSCDPPSLLRPRWWAGSCCPHGPIGAETSCAFAVRFCDVHVGLAVCVRVCAWEVRGSGGRVHRAGYEMASTGPWGQRAALGQSLSGDPVVRLSPAMGVPGGTPAPSYSAPPPPPPTPPPKPHPHFFPNFFSKKSSNFLEKFFAILFWKFQKSGQPWTVFECYSPCCTPRCPHSAPHASVHQS